MDFYERIEVQNDDITRLFGNFKRLRFFYIMREGLIRDKYEK